MDCMSYRHLSIPSSHTFKMLVWIVGHSYVFWCKRYAEQKCIDKDLGLQNVDIKWFAQRGLKWHQLLPLVKTSLHLQHPDLMIVHCGGNDLGTLTGVGLEMLMKDTFGQLMFLFPQTVFVYSNICQRQKWKWSNWFCPQIEKVRKNVNKAVSAYLRDHRMVSIYNNNIHFDMAQIYRSDGEHKGSF